jgi:hypothetical protein
MKRNIEPHVFLIDFDGCVVTHDFPHIGEEVEGAVEVLKKMHNAGHKLILHTCRAGIQLDDAIEWFKNREIELFAVNENPSFETGSRKIYGHWHIDDHNFGSPLKYDPSVHKREFVDWGRINNLLLIKNLI